MFQFGPIVIDFAPLIHAASISPLYMMLFLIAHGGWIPILYVMLWGWYKWYLLGREHHWWSSWQRVLLTIDIPKDNEQSPKAVELLFSQISGAHGTFNFKEKYIEGKIQEGFSFEIASHEGVVRYYVHTTVQFRDLVEASIFAQYPDAQITEVEDYTHLIPDDYPNPDWNLWGAEIQLYNDQSYPIRTYQAFEHQLSGEIKDPMAALLEIMSKMGPGEHAWYQLVIVPTDDAWKKPAMKLINKLAGIKAEHKKTLLDQAVQIPGDIARQVLPAFLGGTSMDAAKPEKTTPSLMQFLPPGESKALEAIHFKLSKVGFWVKFRIIYAAKKSVFQKTRGASGMFGAIKQFNTHDMNGFKPNKKTQTKINYFFIQRRENARKRRMVRVYRSRSAWNGIHPYILNIEELASLWHFPVIGVRAPMVGKTEAKRREPPSTLPTANGFRLRPVAPPSSVTAPAPETLPTESEPSPHMQPSSEAMGAPPPNLPIG